MLSTEGDASISWMRHCILTIAMVYLWWTLFGTVASLVKGTDQDNTIVQPTVQVNGKSWQKCCNVTNHCNGRCTISTSGPDITRFHMESGYMSRQRDMHFSTVVYGVVREVP
jgi:hypothetical protein